VRRMEPRREEHNGVTYFPPRSLSSRGRLWWLASLYPTVTIMDQRHHNHELCARSDPCIVPLKRG
jgi:hypothetical protein